LRFGQIIQSTLISEAPTHNDTRTPLHTSSHAAHTAMPAVSGDIATGTTPASLADAQEAFPGLPNHVVITHILRTEHFDDPADLARLPAVSRAMRDAVAATGLRFEELDEEQAVMVGCLNAVRRLHLAGRLTSKVLLCKAAARSGQLKELKLLRAVGCPWDAGTCWAAVEGGHLEVLQYARAKGCTWNVYTCLEAAEGGHLEVLQWSHANGYPWDTPLCNAAKRGHEAVVRALIEAGADVNQTRDNSSTPLYIAAYNGHEAVVRALIELGADINKANDNGATPLYVGAQEGHETVLRALIELGEDINKPWDNGVTPLYIAAQVGHEVMV